MTVIKAWNSSTSSWEIIAVGAQGPAGDITSSVLNDLSDVVAPTPVDKDFLKYNGTSWVNSSINLSTDTTNTLPIASGGTNNSSLGVTNGGSVYADGSKLATTAAGTSGQVLTSSGTGAPTWSSAPSKLPFGRVASASTTSSTSVTGLGPITGLTCTSFTYSTSRWYRITVTLEASQVAASAANTLLPYVYNSGGAKLFDLPRQTIDTTDVQGYSASVVTNTLSGSLAIQAAANVSGGTITVGNGTVRMSIIVEDIGPV